MKCEPAVLHIEEDRLVINGILAGFRFGSDKFNKEETYHVNVKTVVDPEILEKIREVYYADAKEKYIPDFLKTIPAAGEEIYFNLRTQYEPKSYLANDMRHALSYDEVMEKGDGLAPIKSNVTVSIRLKKNGSMYPLGIKFNTFEKQDPNSYFD